MNNPNLILDNVKVKNPEEASEIRNLYLEQFYVGKKITYRADQSKEIRRGIVEDINFNTCSYIAEQGYKITIRKRDGSMDYNYNIDNLISVSMQ